MPPALPALIVYTLWVSAISVCVGVVIGMALMLWRQRRAARENDVATEQTAAAANPQYEQIQSMLAALLETNTKVDARVELHSHRVEEITEAMERGHEPLVQAARMLVAANQQLQGDLASAKIALEQQRELVDSFKRESRTDVLTDLSNRRAFEDEVREHLDRFRSKQIPFSLLFIDVDHFKRINDLHGHLTGDQVLANLAKCLKTSVCVPSLISRYGGEEFAIILSGTSADSAVKIAEDLRKKIERVPQSIDGHQILVTVSIGIAQADHSDNRNLLVERADRALLEAKVLGRNRCACFETCPEENSVVCA